MGSLLISYVNHKKYIKLAPKQYEVWAEWILEYEQYKYPDDLELVSRLIRDNLTSDFCPPKYREKNLGNPLFGHCYHSTQAMYYFFQDANLKVMSAPCEVADHHWWLQDGDTIIDVTGDQYELLSVNAPYEKGKESKWYGWKNRPHRKTQNLMKLIQPSANLYFKKYKEKPKKVY